MNNTDPDLLESVDIARSWDAVRWASRFIDAFRRNRVAPLWIPSHGELIREIDQLFLAADEDVRRPMRAGLVRAIREWEDDLYAEQSHRVLRMLSWTAARVRALDAGPQLIAILRRYYSELQRETGPFFTTADAIVSVLAGFAPDQDGTIGDFFSSLLYDELITPRLSSTLAVGLSICDARRFPEAFTRYFHQRTKIQGYFADREIVAQFSAAVTHVGMTKMLHRLPIAAQRYLIRTARTAGLITLREIGGFDLPVDEDHRGDPMPLDGRQKLPQQTEVRYEETLSGAIEAAESDMALAATTKSDSAEATAKTDVEVAGTVDFLLAGMEAKTDRLASSNWSSGGAQHGRTAKRS